MTLIPVWKNKKQKEALWESVYRRYYQALCFFAFSFLKDSAKSEDVVQSIFERLLTEDLTSMESDHLQNYLYKSVKNSCINTLETKARQTRIINLLPEDNLLSRNEGNLFHEIVRAELYQLILENIEKLPLQMRQVFKLAYFEGKKNSEIAEKLALSINTVKVHKNNAKKRLQLLLEVFSQEEI
jgi:RNA polymerase sigma-70 factor (ECF subfamily)